MVNTSIDIDLLNIAIRFWLRCVNSSIFSCSSISITLRDVHVFIDLPFIGDDALRLLESDLSLPPYDMTSISYTSYIAAICHW